MNNQLNDLILKTSNYDKDERYMATNDLCQILSKDIKIDEIIEKKICLAILKQLDDKSNDVQSVAVKCLGLLVKKAHSSQINDICDKLCSLLLDGLDSLKDIYSIGLKTLITDVPDELGNNVSNRLISRLLNGISTSTDDRKRECIDVLSDLIRRFGIYLQSFHEEIIKQLIHLLSSDKLIIRKRISICLGNLSIVLNDKNLLQLIDLLLNYININNNNKNIYISTIGIISRNVGYRLGRYLPSIIPILIDCCGDPNDDRLHTDDMNELRESSFPGFESFLLKCPKEVTPYISNILNLSLAYTKYDPNYTYDDDLPSNDSELIELLDNSNMIDSNEYDGNEDYNDTYSDMAGSDNDDDNSWKVRKVSCKVIQTFLSTYYINYIIINHLLNQSTNQLTIYEYNFLYINLSKKYKFNGLDIKYLTNYLSIDVFYRLVDNLIVSIKDREETVRIDVITTLTSIISTTTTIYKDILDSKLDNKIDKSIVNYIDSKILQLLVLSKKHFELSDNFKTKSGLLGLLNQITITLPKGGKLVEFKDVLISWIEKSYSENNQTLKLDALVLLHSIVDKFDSSTYLSILSTKILPLIYSSISNDWSKVNVESFQILNKVMYSISLSSVTSDLSNIPIIIYSSIYPVLQSNDIDQEVKDIAIISIGKYVSYIGRYNPSINDLLIQTIELLVYKLDNEITRFSCLRSLIDIFSTNYLSNNTTIYTLVNNIITNISVYLKQSNRQLKQLTIQLLDVMFSYLTNYLSSQNNNFESTYLSNHLSNYLTIYQDLANCLNDSNDLILNQLIVKFIIHSIDFNNLIVNKNSNYLSIYQSINVTIHQSIYPKIISLTLTTNIPENLLNNIIDLFTQLISNELLDQLISYYINQSNINVNVVSKIISKLIVKLNLTDKYIDIYINNKIDNYSEFLYYLIGHLYHHITFNIKFDILYNKLINNSLDNLNDKLTIGLCFNIKKLITNNITIYLPKLIDLIYTTSTAIKQQIVYIYILKDVIVSYLNLNSINSQNILLDILVNKFLTNQLVICFDRSIDETYRNLFSESISYLTIISPTILLSILYNYIPTHAIVISNIFRSLYSNNLSVYLPSYLSTYLPNYLSNYLLLIPNNKITNELTNYVSTNQPIDHFIYLLNYTASYILTFESVDIDSRKVIILVITNILHYNPEIARYIINSNIISSLIQILEFKQEKIVDLGPFKHRVDEGLPLRKSSLTCMDLSLDVIPENIDISTFLYKFNILLNDKDEVKLQAHQILNKLSHIVPDILLSECLIIIDPLDKTINKKVTTTTAANTESTNATVETERALDVIRSAKRVIVSINSINDKSSVKNDNWIVFYNKLTKAAISFSDI